MPSKLRCAVVGSGFAGSTYAEAIRYAPDAKLVVVAGGRRAQEVAGRHGVRAVGTEGVDGLLVSGEIDAALIASPNPFHAPQAIRAAEAGKHVLVEKPMGMSVAECRAMIAAAERTGVTLMPGHHHRFRRCEVAIKMLLDRDAIGAVDVATLALTEPDAESWLDLPENGGYLLGSGVHGVDLLRFWLGDVRRVAALTGPYRDARAENGSLLLMEFAGGAHGMLQNAVVPGLSRPAGSGIVGMDATVIGQRGAIQGDMYGEVRRSTETGWETITALPSWEDHFAFARIEAYASMAREFVAASLGRRRPSVTGEDGLASVAVVEAAHRAAAERAWVGVA